jgi:chaperonin cofactor prefoldin
MGELDGDRRCWQQIGPVLAEKRVMDVLPVLTENKEQLSAAVKMLSETIEKRETELVELQRKYSIRET